MGYPIKNQIQSETGLFGTVDHESGLQKVGTVCRYHYYCMILVFMSNQRWPDTLQHLATNKRPKQATSTLIRHVCVNHIIKHLFQSTL